MKEMRREELIHRAYQQSHRLTIRNLNYQRWIIRFLNGMLAEDLGDGDITTSSLIEKDSPVNARIISRSAGIIAGLEEITYLFGLEGIQFETSFFDGDIFRKGDLILRIKGSAARILALERTLLNFLQRMSGIATLTSKYVQKADEAGVKIAATRKTLWGDADKKAVAVGGGLTHRLNLSDAILIKENHLKLIQRETEKYIETALQRAYKSVTKRTQFIEIEISNADEFLRALKVLRYKPGTECIIMLDNFPPDDIRELIQKAKEQKAYGHLLFEASGKITLDRIKDYKDTGVDVLSAGALTHSAPAVDFSLLIE